MNFKQITTYDNYVLANMTLGLLQENGINCHLKDENIVTIDPFLSPAVGGIKLMVQEDEFELAQNLIKQAETNYVKTIPCPYCNEHTLTVEEKVDAPTGFWGKLKNQVAYGQTSLYSKKYRCTNCGSLLNDLPGVE
ncbi:MAG: DUF2007 domain-containing protein [Bacteroidetes bacterium]|nr:DUF2007 domain-containing protein [Bacteroidota bacterium]